MASVLKLAGTMMLYVWFLCCLTAFQGASTQTAPVMKNPPLLNYGSEHGDLEMKDLMQGETIELPLNMSYFGSKYNELYISADGLISFEKGVYYHKSIIWKEGIRNKNTDKPFLAPFYFDGFKGVGLRKEQYKDKIYYRVMEKGNIRQGANYYHEQVDTLKWLGEYVKDTTLNANNFEADMAVVVTWDDVSSDSSDSADVLQCVNDASRCKTATFQAILVSDKSSDRTVAILNYFKMKIPIKSSYQAGFKGGYGRDWYNVIPCHGRCGSLTLDNNQESYLEILPTLKGSDTVGRFILEVGGETVVRGGCLPKEFTSGILEVYPRQVSMLGGEKLEVSGKCGQRSSKIYCRFGDSKDSPVVEGTMYNEMKGSCPVPLLTTSGNIFVAWSTENDPEDSKKWKTDRTISVIHPSRATPSVTVSKDVKDAWFSRDASEITVVWDPKKFTETDASVDINLIGYRETKDKVEYKTLQKIGRGSAQRGSFTFNVADHRCMQNCLEFQQGLLEVALPSEYLGVANERVAVRHGPIPLGWYVNEKMTEDNGSDWSDQMCRKWHAEDGKHTDWLSALLPCPCTLDQALADFGRFQPDAGCSLFTGSKCTYHKKAKHCVRAVVPTKDAAGNQCCYSQSGELVYSQLSYQGSTPDRSHDWGAYPYGGPNLVPSLSHWKHDVVTFYYCCLWNEYKLCDLYMERRPTQDCKNYNVPAVATLRGVPHVTTFDGLSYEMVGEGDFYLLQTKDLEIQGRFASRRGAWDLGTLSGGSKPWSAPVLREVGLMYKQSIFVDVSVAPESADPPRGLDIRVRRERRFFVSDSTMWQDFKDLSIVNNAVPGEPNEHNNFTILISNNVGVNVFSKNGLLHITVALPPEMKKPAAVMAGMGLLGTYDGISANDFMSKKGSISPPGTPQTKFFEDFVSTWTVDDERLTLFPFFEKSPPLDKEHVYSKYDEIPSDFPEAPSDDKIADVCGEENNCKWDYRITGSPQVARTTKGADQLLNYIKESLEQVDNCGLPEVGRNAVMDKYDFSVGSTITVTGCGKGMSFRGTEKYRCVREPKSEAVKEKRDDYGLVKTDKDDGMEYIIHWLPKPSVLCTAGSAEGGLDLMWIIIIAVAAVVLLAAIAIIIFVVLRRRKNSDKYSSTSQSQSRPKPANRRTGGDHDEKSGQAMLPREDRSPVYKPSKEPVQIQGSTV
ncbi:hypothetical protein RRG08_004149 [Elysia crispata]|uniref:Protein mesh-like n=1 Tax=Elysia crispata TaxID=231223 RepID=A0AAE0YWC7_9GAST|nr:hypothetical protein RRG08_004149 [Elysia crispata]